ncbi:hypothetical protein [Bradyrhizobium sp. TM239]|uniref:hypothetical protein n=1 Tax=Bradyrhizobium sp. TM239 TaxID=2599802 RepID=UPI0027D4F80A|nr:hypothetical protein TM239_41180 [Bradyrhizobium sp. TM239]
MSAEPADMKYYFGFRVTNPVGSWVVEGPFETNEIAKAKREQAKGWGGQVTIPFVASSKEEALNNCDRY